MAAVISIISRHGLRIDACCRNQPNKSIDIIHRLDRILLTSTNKSCTFCTVEYMFEVLQSSYVLSNLLIVLVLQLWSNFISTILFPFIVAIKSQPPLIHPNSTVANVCNVCMDHT